MTDLIREIAQTMRHNKLRLALTGFAVAWGIFMLIVLLSLANGLVNGFQEHMIKRDTNSLTIWGGQTSRAWHGLKEGRFITLKDHDIERIETDRDAPVKSVAASVSNDTVRFSTITDVISGGYMGVFPSNREFDGAEIIAGRFINDRDMARRRRVLVISRQNAEKLFESADKAVGQTVTGMGLAWTIVGVYEHRWRSGSYAPYTTAMALDGNTGEVGSLQVELHSISSIPEGEAAENAVRGALARSHEFDPEDENAVWINNRFTDAANTAQAMNILVYAMWIIGILTLLSGIVGVSNIMFVSVRERTHEIGIRRAIGARPSNILVQVVLESVAVTTLFGYIGIVLGTIVMGVISHIIGNSLEMISNPSVDLKTAFEVTGVLIVAGALAGLFPAIKATKVRPVEALRDE